MMKNVGVVKFFTPYRNIQDNAEKKNTEKTVHKNVILCFILVQKYTSKTTLKLCSQKLNKKKKIYTCINIHPVVIKPSLTFFYHIYAEKRFVDVYCQIEKKNFIIAINMEECEKLNFMLVLKKKIASQEGDLYKFGNVTECFDILGVLLFFSILNVNYKNII